MRDQIGNTLAGLRAEILGNQALRGALEHAAANGGVLVSVGGNAGDGLIHMGANTLVGELDLDFARADSSECDNLPADAVAVVVGGAMIEGLWDERVRHLRRHLENGGKVVYLPCTFVGATGVLSRYRDQITAFLRDRPSYDNVVASGATAHLTHDLAFAVPTAFYLDRWHRGSLGLAAFRTDDERAIAELPFGSVDLSLLWNGAVWGDSQVTRERSDILARVMGSYCRLETDRLHLAILGAALGLEVTLHGTAGGKTEAVYEQTLHRFPNVRFAAAGPDKEREGWLPRDLLLDRAREFARRQQEWYEPELERRQTEIERLRAEISNGTSDAAARSRLEIAWLQGRLLALGAELDEAQARIRGLESAIAPHIQPPQGGPFRRLVKRTGKALTPRKFGQ